MFEAGSCQIPLHSLVRSQLRTSSELAPNMFGASSELVSVMEFGFYCSVLFAVTLFEKDEFYVTWNCRRPEKSDSFGQALAFVGIPVGI